MCYQDTTQNTYKYTNQVYNFYFYIANLASCFSIEILQKKKNNNNYWILFLMYLQQFFFFQNAEFLDQIKKKYFLLWKEHFLY